MEKYTTLVANGKIKVNQVNLYYELYGKGTPIILIAGFSCDHTFWAGILLQLMKHHLVLIFDNRGVGQSDAPDHAYAIEMMADDVMALSNRLGLEKPVIVGQSMGSAIAQEIGKRYAQQIKKLILINTFAKLSKAPEIAFEFTLALHRLHLPLRYRVQSIAPWVFSSAFLAEPNQLENLIKLAEVNRYPQSLLGYAHQLSALKAFDSHSWLYKIAVAALIISAEEDIIAPLTGANSVQKGIGENTQHLILPGGHASPIEQPDKVANAILNFINH